MYSGCYRRNIFLSGHCIVLLKKELTYIKADVLADVLSVIHTDICELKKREQTKPGKVTGTWTAVVRKDREISEKYDNNRVLYQAIQWPNSRPFGVHGAEHILTQGASSKNHPESIL